MKKVAIVALVGLCGFAMASSLNVPWFVDLAPAGTGLNGDYPWIVGIVSVHNNSPDDLECWIDYYAGDGTYLDYGDIYNPGDTSPHYDWACWWDGTPSDDRLYVWSREPIDQQFVGNSFIIPGNATVSFRPVEYDPSKECLELPQRADATEGGQESDAGVKVPNRPLYNIPGDNPDWENGRKNNGACVIGWTGASTLIQGRYIEYYKGVEAAYLLPGGS